MKYVLFCICILLIISISTATIEDFTTYTEVDPNNDITVTSNVTTWDTMDRNQDTYVYKDFGINYFTDFVVYGIFNTSTSDEYSRVAISMFSNDINDIGAQTDATYIRIYSNTHQTGIQCKNGTNSADYNLVTDTTYWYKFNRTNENVTLTIFSDAGRTNTLVTLNTSQNYPTKYRYFYSISSIDMSATNKECSGYHSDVEVGNATPGVAGNESPNITSNLPTDLTPNVYENVNSSFNATANQSSNWRVWLNGTHIEWQNGTTDCIYYNKTWLNASSPNNVTFEAHNTSDNSLYDTITWDVNVLLNSVDINITYWDPDSGGLVETINVTNITAGVQNIYFILNDTNSGWLYTVTHSNGTYVDSATATYENESLNFSIPLIEDSYNITETSAVNTSTIIIPANTYGMINNWTVATNFSNIAANESNDVVFTYYNVTSGEWKSHYPPYSWNSNYVIPLEASVMMFVNAQTTVTATIITPANTNLYVSWNMLFVEGTDNETIADIKSDVGTNCTAVWAYNSTAGAYTSSSTYSVQPCQGVLVYITQDMTWTRSDL